MTTKRPCALITGATSGIGYELAKQCASKHIDCVLVSRNIDKMNEIKTDFESTYNITVTPFQIDLSDETAPQRVFDFTTSQGLHIDILINNAGFGDFGPFDASRLERQNNMVRLNILALMNLTHYYVQPMIQKGSGRILNVASTAAFQAGPIMSVYYATKAFVLSFSESLSVELKPKGIFVTALCPGPTKTGFVENANLQRSGLFTNLKNTTAEFVAKKGYQSMLKGKVIEIPGLANKTLICMSKFAPRKLVRTVILHIQK
ncbi:hypothetical protein AOC36_07350 [Erysipelothrix larvae]|uniref:Short-chain dehydrogenase n=1 Tax=Erysipelothrix larvae TaxID=1514105 RepID=A0A0X8H0F8_9FIRM|nr:SDR family oxidoreductase [Erysipelothrix larvae]AMC93804.1 hypothetical protein AOC36_07350 [Erysipelothrix larvae]